MNYIELFAGCGGLSLGLKSVGFKLVLANELSPMAAESYAYNFFQENLEAASRKKKRNLKKTLWLSSNYNTSDLSQRLRENPFSYPSLGEGVCDLHKDGANLRGSLVVGNIIDLNNWLGTNEAALKAIQKGDDNREHGLK